MAADVVRYDQDQYDYLIAKCQDIADSLHKALFGGKEPLGQDVALQPEQQTWQPAADLVAAGRYFFGTLDEAVDSDGGPLKELTTLHDGLVKARAIFQTTDQDLTKTASSAFTQLAPDLA